MVVNLDHVVGGLLHVLVEPLLIGYQLPRLACQLLNQTCLVSLSLSQVHLEVSLGRPRGALVERSLCNDILLLLKEQADSEDPYMLLHRVNEPIYKRLGFERVEHVTLVGAVLSKQKHEVVRHRVDRVEAALRRCLEALVSVQGVVGEETHNLVVQVDLSVAVALVQARVESKDVQARAVVVEGLHECGHIVFLLDDLPSLLQGHARVLTELEQVTRGRA